MAGKRKADSAAVRAEKARRTRRHYEKVLASARRNNLRNTALQLLQIMMFARGDFYEPLCRVSRRELEEIVGRCAKTVKVEMRRLRQEGYIQAVSGAQGGRVEGGAGQAPTYRFFVVGEGASSAPRDTDDSGGGELKAAILAAFEDRPATAEQWIEPLAVAGIERGTLTLIAPSDFHRGQVEQPHGEAILTAAAAHDPSIKRVRFSA